MANIFIRAVLVVLLMIAERRQRNFVFFATRLIFSSDILDAVCMLQIFVLVRPSGAKFFNHPADTSVYLFENYLFVFLHANTGVIINACYTGAKISENKTELLPWRSTSTYVKDTNKYVPIHISVSK